MIQQGFYFIYGYGIWSIQVDSSLMLILSFWVKDNGHPITCSISCSCHHGLFRACFIWVIEDVVLAQLCMVNICYGFGGGVSDSAVKVEVTCSVYCRHVPDLSVPRYNSASSVGVLLSKILGPFPHKCLNNNKKRASFVVLSILVITASLDSIWAPLTVLTVNKPSLSWTFLFLTCLWFSASLCFSASLLELRTFTYLQSAGSL